jgi:pyruvate/2-oxoglutarate dehydrogenase complex dihydrolipoamide acyltransferase (E2) component
LPTISSDASVAASVQKAEVVHEKARSTSQRAQSITVPVMGEGIRNAKVVALLKNPGDSIELDDPLCEVETDKAVYPIESSFAGTMGDWKTEVGATVDIGQEIGTILSGEASWRDQLEAATEASAQVDEVESASVSRSKEPQRRDSVVDRIEPALSGTITRRLGRVVPANLQIDARWGAIQAARNEAKKLAGCSAASPSAMVAWSVVRAIEKHPAFRRLVLEDDTIVQSEALDLGVAVALDGDRLATAVITRANERDWPDFLRSYNDTIEATRNGRVDAVNSPVLISSLGAFGVRAAAPIVVPPSIATLFVGAAHQELVNNSNGVQGEDVITLSLTFDHRVVNGAGAANFVREIADQIEAFTIPTS